MELFGKYEVGRLLGCGAFAKVYYARNIRTGQSVAIKVINKKKIVGTTLMGNIKREITIMSRLCHPNIVRLYEVLASKNKIYFVMEFIKGGELFAKVAKGRFSEDLSRSYFRQLVSAIAYCHSKGVYHRDLKPENLLVDEGGNLKVTDFGLSALKAPTNGSDQLLKTLCGTPAYVAPEILAKKGYDGATVDVWSCGVVLYVISAGYLPFQDRNLMNLYRKIYKGEFKCPKWMSGDLKRFLARLLDVNPSTRITLAQIVRDPWFTKSKDTKTPFQLDLDSTSYPDDYDRVFYKPPPPVELEKSSSSSSSLNAFDLISFSSGLDLSGLFNPITHSDRFVSSEPITKIIENIQTAASSENVKVKTKEEGHVVDLEGPNGHFVVRLEISPLTDELLVIEVKTKGSDSSSFTLLWTNKIKPHLDELLYRPDSQTPLPLPSTTNLAAEA